MLELILDCMERGYVVNIKGNARTNYLWITVENARKYQMSKGIRLSAQNDLTALGNEIQEVVYELIDAVDSY